MKKLLSIILSVLIFCEPTMAMAEGNTSSESNGNISDNVSEEISSIEDENDFDEDSEDFQEENESEYSSELIINEYKSEGFNLDGSVDDTIQKKCNEYNVVNSYSIPDIFVESEETNNVESIETENESIDVENEEDNNEIIINNETNSGTVFCSNTYTTDSGSVTWTFYDNNVVYVKGTGEIQDNWTIPSKYGKLFDQTTNSQITDIKSYVAEVIVEDGISGIGSNAFSGFNGLTSISLPDTISYIGDYAFFNCAGLKNISIPKKTASIGLGAFALCFNLETVSFNSSLKSIGDSAFYSDIALTEVILPEGLTTLEGHVFDGCDDYGYCESLVKAVIPESLDSMGDYCFSGCKSLSTVEFSQEQIGDLNTIPIGTFLNCVSLSTISVPKEITNICEGAFYNCQSLTTATVYGSIARLAFIDCYHLSNVTIKGECDYIGYAAFAYCGYLTNIEIPKSCQTIESLAFLSCSALQSIDLPTSLKTVGDKAFYGCSSLKSISFPEGVTELGEAVFAGQEENGFCTSLASVSLPSTLTKIGNYCFAYCSSLESLELPAALSTIPEGTFGNCTKLTKINIPNKCTSIGDQAFYGCTLLESISFPNSLTSIGEAVFYECKALNNIQFGNSLKTIGSHAFTYCEKLETISLPSTVTELGQYSFSECNSLKKVSSLGSLSALEEGLFIDCAQLTEINLPETVTSMGNYVFYNCSSLESISLPENISTLGIRAFQECSSLSEISIPQKITSIPDLAFVYCKSLKNVECSAVSSIGTGAFYDCTKLEQINFCDNLKSIGDYAFSNCEKLVIDEFPSTLETVGECAFTYCKSIETVSITGEKTSLNDYVFAGCESIEEFKVSNNNAYYSSENGVLYSKDKTELLFYPSSSTASEFKLADTVTSLDEGVFYKCTNLKKITLNKNITEIPDHLFYGCESLETVVFSATITKVGKYAFGFCKSLKALPSLEAVTSIGEGAFFRCESITRLVIPDSITVIPEYMTCLCSSLEEVELPSTLTEIGTYAFAYCSKLDNVDLPDTLTAIQEAAFAECDSLSSITVPEGVVELRSLVFYSCDSLKNVRLDGDVFVVGNYTFEDDTALDTVIFSGNALESIGENGFSNTNDEMIFFYNALSEGWSVPEWEGPDSNTYKTATFYTGTCGSDINWELDTSKGVLTLSGSGEMFTWTDKTKVPWYEYKNLIKTVVIEDGITSIGSNAFIECSELVEVTIPDSIKTAGYASFALCEKLETVNSPEGLSVLGKCMFYGDSSLTSVLLNNNLETIPSSAFENCTSLTGISLGINISKIEQYAFSGCTSLKKVILPDSLTEIGEYAFHRNSSLTNVSFGEKIKTIGNFAFYGCVSLENIDFPSSLTTLGEGAFANCKGLNTVSFDGKPKEIKNGCFAYSAINSLYLEEDISDVIAKNVFSNLTGTMIVFCDFLDAEWEDVDGQTFTVCKIKKSGECDNQISWSYDHNKETLTISGTGDMPDYKDGEAPWNSVLTLAKKVVIEDGITYVGNYAFSQMTNLESVVISDSVLRIGNYSFAEDNCLNTLDFGEKLTEIGEGAFINCNGLTDVTLPDSLQCLDDFSFYSCLGLEKISISDNLKKIGDSAFYNCAELDTISLPESLTSLGEAAFCYCISLESISVPKNINSLDRYTFAYCKNLNTVELQGESVEIEEYAFAYAASLCNASFEKMTSIGKAAFFETGFSSISLSNKTSYVGDYSFADCDSLTSIQVSSSNTALYGEHYTSDNGILLSADKRTVICYPAGKTDADLDLPQSVSSISDAAFYGCDNLEKADLENSAITSLGTAAFAYCNNLSEVTLPASLDTISRAAFGNCYNLSQVNIKNTSNINIADEAFYECVDLSSVVFDGNAPKSIGNNAFYKTPDTIEFTYNDKNTGWTAMSWIGPDNNVYSTNVIHTKKDSTTEKAVTQTIEIVDGDNLKLTINNLKDTNINGKVLFVIYDGNKMVDFCQKDVYVDNGCYKILYANYGTLGLTGTITIKTILLDSKTNNPLGKNGILTNLSSNDKEAGITIANNSGGNQECDILPDDGLSNSDGDVVIVEDNDYLYVTSTEEINASGGGVSIEEYYIEPNDDEENYLTGSTISSQNESNSEIDTGNSVSMTNIYVNEDDLEQFYNNYVSGNTGLSYISFDIDYKQYGYEGSEEKTDSQTVNDLKSGDSVSNDYTLKSSQEVTLGVYINDSYDEMNLNKPEMGVSNADFLSPQSSESEGIKDWQIVKEWDGDIISSSELVSVSYDLEQNIDDTSNNSNVLKATSGSVEGKDYILLKSGDYYGLFIKDDEGVYVESQYGYSTAEIDSNGIITVKSQNGISYSFNSDGNIDKVVDLNGQFVKYVYDNGVVTSVESSDGESISYEYTDGKITKVSDGSSQVSYEYTGDYLTSVTNAYGTTSYEYDTTSSGSKKGTVTKVTYNNGTCQHYEYDDEGRVTATWYDDNEYKTTYTYLSDSIVKITEASGEEYTYYYDNNGNILKEIDSDGAVSEVLYNDNSLPSKITYNGNDIIEYSYDDDGNITSVDMGDGNVTGYTYDQYGNITSIEDQNQKITTYDRDDKGNLTSITYADGSKESYSYDTNGNVTSYTDQEGNVTKYTYDESNQMISTKLSDGLYEYYEYDDSGNLLSITSKDSTNSENKTAEFSYNQNGDLTSYTHISGEQINYAYDEYGNISSITDADGEGASYTYDKYGRIATLCYGKETIATYTYGSDSALQKVQYSNGTYVKYTYSSDQLSSIYYYDAKDTLQSYSKFEYDDMGNLISKETENGTWQYTSDSSGQLTSAKSIDGKETVYNYDASGNKTSVQENGVETKYTSNELNQVVKAGNKTFTYNQNGYLTKMKDAEGNETKYTYNSNGKLVSVVEPDGDTYKYTYDALGYRSSVEKNGKTTSFVYSPTGDGDIVASYTDGVKTSYVYGDGLTAAITNGKTYYYQFDQVGNTIAITDENGSVVNSYSYDQEGRIVSSKETISNIFTYVGKYGICAEDNGLVYMRSRYYSRDTGTFITPDPAGQYYDLNEYRYANNNLVEYVDISGESFIKLTVKYFTKNPFAEVEDISQNLGKYLEEESKVEDISKGFKQSLDVTTEGVPIKDSISQVGNKLNVTTEGVSVKDPVSKVGNNLNLKAFSNGEILIAINFAGILLTTAIASAWEYKGEIASFLIGLEPHIGTLQLTWELGKLFAELYPDNPLKKMASYTTEKLIESIDKIKTKVTDMTKVNAGKDVRNNSGVVMTKKDGEVLSDVHVDNKNVNCSVSAKITDQYIDKNEEDKNYTYEENSGNAYIDSENDRKQIEGGSETTDSDKGLSDTGNMFSNYKTNGNLPQNTDDSQTTQGSGTVDNGSNNNFSKDAKDVVISNVIVNDIPVKDAGSIDSYADGLNTYTDSETIINTLGIKGLTGDYVYIYPLQGYVSN